MTDHVYYLGGDGGSSFRLVIPAYQDVKIEQLFVPREAKTR